MKTRRLQTGLFTLVALLLSASVISACGGGEDPVDTTPSTDAYSASETVAETLPETFSVTESKPETVPETILETTIEPTTEPETGTEVSATEPETTPHRRAGSHQGRGCVHHEHRLRHLQVLLPRICDMTRTPRHSN